MKITDIIVKEMSFRRRKVFKIAFTASMYARGVYVKLLTDEGISGMGEACPMPFVTGETIGGVMAAIEHMKGALLGADPEDPAAIHAIMDRQIAANSAAKAAIDMACYDIMGKKAGLPVYRLLGAQVDTIQTDMTIGIDTPEKMAEDALSRVQQGFRVLKLKGGISKEDDLTNFAAIRAAVGPDIELRVDFNQGYDRETAAYMLSRLPEFGITEAEQPVPAWDTDSMAALKQISPVELMADESVHSPRDAELVCQKDACHVVNIKLMKCGGIWPALQIAAVAKRYGKPCIVGCMSETKLGISAGAAVVAACADQMGVIDLDSFMSFADTNEGIQGGLTVEGDMIRLSAKPGFGFEEFEM